jgi:uncharacterized glyoxalase superfamily protein PhnB
MSTKVVPVLNVASIEASLAFYRDTLGFTAGDAIPGEDGKLMHAEATLGDVMLMFGSNPDAPVGGGMSLYLSLPDVGAQYERVRRAGARSPTRSGTSSGATAPSWSRTRTVIN